MDQNNDKEMYDNADKFIGLANEMSKTVSPGEIGIALGLQQPDTVLLKHQCEQRIWLKTRINI